VKENGGGQKDGEEGVDKGLDLLHENPTLNLGGIPNRDKNLAK
jgi:hypothetical protein